MSTDLRRRPKWLSACVRDSKKTPALFQYPGSFDRGFLRRTENGASRFFLSKNALVTPRVPKALVVRR
jgi:hypothetical protein